MRVSVCLRVCERVWCVKVEISGGTATTDPDTQKSAQHRVNPDVSRLFG